MADLSADPTRGSLGRRLIAAGAATAVFIAACGGGTASQPPGGTATPPTQPPATQAPAITAAPTQAGPTADPYAFLAQFEGTYSGTWKNTTYGSTGPASIKMQLDRTAGTVALTLTLGGNVFGNPAPAPEDVTATITLGEGISFTSATFGATTVSVDLAGGVPNITVTSPDVPSARIKAFTATASIADPDTIDFEYDVTFRDSTPTAHGTATLTRE